MSLLGASPETIRMARSRSDPLPGTTGFAGALDDTLVRDVLGRYPLFVETDPECSHQWSHDPTELNAPASFPAGCVQQREPDGSPAGTPRQVWTLPDSGPETDSAVAVRAVREALEKSIAEVDTEGLAIAFSGGVDSALLAAHLDVPLYTVGFPDSHDIEAARTAAALLDRELNTIELDHETLESAVPTVATAIGRSNAMDVQIALGLYLVGERVSADGFDRLALGQGADELFGGYAKVAKAPDDDRVDAETVRGARREVLETLPDQLERDTLALWAAGVDPVVPILHDRVIRAGLTLSGNLLVDGETRKVALRRAARPWLPEELAVRDKKAMQYGSLLARELDRLARQAGYKRRMENHIQRYIESL